MNGGRLVAGLGYGFVHATEGLLKFLERGGRSSESESSLRFSSSPENRTIFLDLRKQI